MLFSMILVVATAQYYTFVLQLHMTLFSEEPAAEDRERMSTPIRLRADY
jgi:hypothetical protein